MRHRSHFLLIGLFLAAIAGANLITASYGPTASIYTALVLVAFDLVLRDAIHDRTTGAERIVVMAILCVFGGLISYAINADAGPIAVASAAALSAAIVVDALVYHLVRHEPWFERVNLSNVPAALVDSIVFVAIAFPGMLWGIALTQAAMKIAGGVVFAAILARTIRKGIYSDGLPSGQTLTYRP